MSNLICPECGQMIVNVKNKKIRSCPHFPITIEVENDYNLMTIGEGDNSFGVGSRHGLDQVFERIIEYVSKGIFDREEA